MAGDVAELHQILQTYQDARVRRAATNFLQYIQGREYRLVGTTFAEGGKDGYDPEEAARLIRELREALNG